MTELDIHTAFSSASAGELRPHPLMRVIYRVCTRSSKKRVQPICRAISDETGRDTVRLYPLAMVSKLNRMLTGWANDCCLGAVSQAYSAVDMHARRRLHRWLCDKHNEPRPGYLRFLEASLHSVFGLVQLPHRTASLPCEKA